jgi:hypothetical protein
MKPEKFLLRLVFGLLCATMLVVLPDFLSRMFSNILAGISIYIFGKYIADSIYGDED